MDECRICLENEDSIRMISPCKCKGSIQYIHVHCFIKEIKASKVYSCSICKTKYCTRFRVLYQLFKLQLEEEKDEHVDRMIGYTCSKFMIILHILLYLLYVGTIMLNPQNSSLESQIVLWLLMIFGVKLLCTSL